MIRILYSLFLALIGTGILVADSIITIFRNLVLIVISPFIVLSAAFKTYIELKLKKEDSDGGSNTKTTDTAGR